MAHIAKPTRDPLPFGPGLNAHRMVVETAIEIANENFETFSHSNEWHRFLRAGGKVSDKQARALFALRVAPHFYEDARRVLTDLLTQPDTRIPRAMKDEIHDALTLDYALRSKRRPASDAMAS